jgi:CRP/FNR family transcriptional regulator
MGTTDFPQDEARFGAARRLSADRTGLQALDFIQELSPSGRELALARILRLAFPRAQTIIEKGQEVSGAYFVVSGRLRVSTITAGGREAPLYLLNPGETCVLALNSLFNDLLYPAWVQTEIETIVAIVPGPVYRTLFEREQAVQSLTVKALSNVVFRLMAELEQVHFCSVEQRLANLLLTQASGRGVVKLTQQELADRLGTTREVVARAIRGFVGRGFVETSRGQVAIAKRRSLARLVGPPGNDDP